MVFIHFKKSEEYSIQRVLANGFPFWHLRPSMHLNRPIEFHRSLDALDAVNRNRNEKVEFFSFFNILSDK